MTTDQIAEYYADLLIIQYRGQPKAHAMMKAWVTPVIMDQLPTQIQNAFNLNTAVGVQLDILGKYVGVSRQTYTAAGPVTLTDADYLTLIKMVIVKNNSGSSLSIIQNLLATAFPGFIFVSDNQSMGLNYLILRNLGTPELLEALVYGDYLPRPMGVQVSVVIVDVLTRGFFGFRDYNNPGVDVSPFNNYPLYQFTYPWLSYKS